MASASLQDRSLNFDRPQVMGVLNTTPDSFSDGGRYVARDDAVAHALSMELEGADIIDIGGESTRPGSRPVDDPEQIERVVPVIEAIRTHSDIPISIDTTRAAVAAKALDSGANMVNDVSAGRDDSELFALVAERRVPVVLMHMRGEPRTMQKRVRYPNDDVVTEVLTFLRDRAAHAESAGIKRDMIILDPGIGFGKTVAHNLCLLRNLPRIVATGYPVLLGVSRKSFLGAITDRPVEERMAGTAAAVTAGVLAGAMVMRVHDVAAMRDVVHVATAIRSGHPSDGEGLELR